MGMRLIITEKKIREAKFSGSKGNITETVANAIIRAIAKFYAEKALNPESGGKFFIDLSKEMEILRSKAPEREVIVKDEQGNDKIKKIRSKYDLRLKSILWEVPQLIGSTKPPHYLPRDEQIKLNINMPYSSLEYEIYLDSLKKKQADPEAFNTSLRTALLRVLGGKKYTSREPLEEKTLESLKQFAKQNRKQVPEFTTSNVINRYNLQDKNINSAFSPKTQEFVDQAIEKIKPSPAKMSVIYDLFRKKKIINGIEEIVPDLKSSGYHEIFHSRQYSGIKDTTNNSNETERKKKLAELFNKQNLLLMPTYVYTSSTTDFVDDAVDKFHYYSRPIEIDARAEEYRKTLTELKKTKTSVAGEKLFDIILEKETRFVEGDVLIHLRVSRAASDFIKNQALIKDEVKYKCLAQVFEQIAYHIKDISSTDPRYKEKADEYIEKVRDINEKIKSTFESTTKFFDPAERLPRTISAGYR